MIKPKVVLLIFVSGKIVLTGAKVNFCLVLSLLPVDAYGRRLSLVDRFDSIR
jgi:hypothetical protein